MRERFCPVCGKVTDTLVENLCPGCFFKERDIVKVPDILEAEVCRSCLKHRHKGRWTYVEGESFEDVMGNVAFKEVKSAVKVVDLANPEVGIQLGDTKQKSTAVYLTPVDIHIEGTIKDNVVATDLETTVRIITELCTDCSRQSGGYFKAILQARGAEGLSRQRKAMIKEKVLTMADTIVKDDPKAFISKITDLKEGVDFYFGSKKAARKIARAIKQEMGGHISESAKLMGRDRQGKDIYRISIALRLSE